MARVCVEHGSRRSGSGGSVYFLLKELTHPRAWNSLCCFACDICNVSSTTFSNTPSKMTNSPVTASLASSATATEADVQSQSSRRSHVSHFRIVYDQAGVTRDALEWRYPGEGTEENPYSVDFTPCDPYNPQGWTSGKKWFITILSAISTLAVAFVSSAFSGGLPYIIEEFHVSTELSILGISLFVVGFGVGPLLWAPASEFYGRQVLYFFTYMALVAFNAGTAGVMNFPGMVVLRFFAGAFGSSPLTNSGGVIADMFSQQERGFATAIFAAAPFMGPSLGEYDEALAFHTGKH